MYEKKFTFIVASALHLGVVFRERCGIKQVLTKGNVVTGVETTTGTVIDADILVNCTGLVSYFKKIFFYN